MEFTLVHWKKRFVLFWSTIAIWECLFRSMRHFDFVALHDLDEFIVPVRHENITALLGTFIKKTIVDSGLKASFWILQQTKTDHI